MPGIVYKISGDNSQFQKDVNESQNIAQGGFNKISALGIAAWAAIGAAVIKATKAGVDFLKDSVNTGMAFDKSMAQVAATMGTTVDQIGDLREFAQEMGAATAFSATQAADALNYMALAGYDAKTSMEMLPNVLNLAAAGGIELARASDMVTDAQSALGLTLPQTSQLVDKMAKASSKSNTSVAQLGEAILTVGGTAKVLSGETTELATMLGVLADNGIKGAEGGTALRNVILAFTAPTQKASDLMKKLGVNAFDSTGKLRPLNDVFGDLNGAMAKMNDKQKSEILSTIFHKADLKSANALLATSVERFEELSSAIDGAWYTANGLNQAFDEIGFDTSQVNIDGLLKSFEKLGVSAENVQYALDVSQGNAQDFVETIWELSDAGVTLDDVYAALPIDIDELQMAFDRATGAAQAMADTQLDNLAGDITLAQSAAEGLKISISNKLTPTLREFVKAGTKELEKLKAAFDEGGFKGLGKQFGDSLSEMVEMVAQKVPEIAAAAGAFVKTFIGNIVDMTIKSKDKIAAGIKTAFSNISLNIKDVLKKLPDIAETALELGKEFVLNFASAISNNVHNIIGSASDILSRIGTALQDGIPKLGKQLVEILVQAILDFPSLLRGIGEVVFGTISGIIEAIPQAIAGIFSGGNKWRQQIDEEIDSLFVDAREAAKTRVTEISEEVSKLGEEAKTAFEDSKKVLEDFPSVIGEVDASFKYAEHWVEVIEDLGGKTDLTKDEQAKLKLAIDELNKILPETEQIVKNENGEWQINIDKIKESIETLKMRNKLTAMLEYAKKVETDLFAAEVKRDQITGKLNDKLAEQNELKTKIQDYENICYDIGDALGVVFTQMRGGVSEVDAVQRAFHGLPQPMKDFAKQMGITSVSSVKDLQAIENAAWKVLTGDPQVGGEAGLYKSLNNLNGEVKVLKKSVEDCEGSITNYRESLSSIYDTASKTAKEMEDVDYSGAVNKAEDAADKTVKKVSDKLDELPEKAQETGEKTGEKLNVGLTAQKEKLKETFAKLGKLADEGYAEGIDANKGTVNESARGVARDSSNSLKDSQAKQTAKQAGEDNITAYNEGMQSKGSLSEKLAASISDKTAKAAILKKYFYNNGVYGIEGLVAGLGDTAEEAYAKARKIAENVSKALKDALKINSPSRVTREIGKGVPEGLALGIEDDEQVRNVERAAKETANAGVKSLTAAIDTSINASPVVLGGGTDMSEVVTLLKQYLPDIGAPIVLDTGELVGHTINSTDAELGELQRRRARYE